MISRLPAPPIRLPLPRPSLPLLPAAQGFVRGFVASACLGAVQEGGLSMSPQQSKRILRQALLGGTAMAAGSQVAATIGRKTRDARQGRLAAEWVRGFNGHVWQPLSEGCAETAERFAATLFLRGADAVYVAVAHLSDAVLLTYDAEVIERACKVVRVMTPDVWLRKRS